MSPEQLAQLFHETYERLAYEYGYVTRLETAIPWEQIPEDSKNKRLMIAVCTEILDKYPIANEEIPDIPFPPKSSRNVMIKIEGASREHEGG